jgi:hypothetical protein
MIHIHYYSPPINVWVFQAVSLLQVSLLKLLTHFYVTLPIHFVLDFVKYTISLKIYSAVRLQNLVPRG